VIVDKHGQVLLGEKKRGFGSGYFNGFGGKVEAGEAVVEGAARELKEEACIEPISMTLVGILTFICTRVFRVPDFSGTPTETEEMRPVWFKHDEVPFDQMWADDEHWYPHFLSGKMFAGIFTFINTTKLVWHTLRVVEGPEQLRVNWRAATSGGLH